MWAHWSPRPAWPSYGIFRALHRLFQMYSGSIALSVGDAATCATVFRCMMWAIHTVACWMTSTKCSSRCASSKVEVRGDHLRLRLRAAKGK
jgi:hypothetical protein